MADPLEAAASALRRGELVAYPTDTLHGLAVRADSEAALDRLRAAKDRPPTMPISVVVSSTEELEPLLQLSPMARAFIRRRLPGPYTVLATGRRTSPLAATLCAPDGSLGVRVPAHPIARELARRAGPITATSANRHGQPSPTDVPGLRRLFGSAVAVYLAGAPRPSGTPSELVDLRGDAPRVVPRTRRGASR